MQGLVELEVAAGDASHKAPLSVELARQPRRGGLRQGGKAPYVFLAPYLLLSLVFFVYPFIRAVVLAFYQTNGPRSMVFVGFANFAFLLHDGVFHTALWNTLVFTFFSLFL